MIREKIAAVAECGFKWLQRLWDWVDARDIDKHAVSMAFLFGTSKVTTWAMYYAEHSTRPGLETAAVIAAATAPFMAAQTAIIKWYFESRTA